MLPISRLTNPRSRTSPSIYQRNLQIEYDCERPGDLEDVAGGEDGAEYWPVDRGGLCYGQEVLGEHCQQLGRIAGVQYQLPHGVEVVESAEAGSDLDHEKDCQRKDVEELPPEADVEKPLIEWKIALAS